MDTQWIVADALQALKSGVPDHRIFIASHFPLLATASMEDIVKAALAIVTASDLEEKLRSEALSPDPPGIEEREALFIAQLTPEELARAKQLLLPKQKKIKTHPIIVVETGKVFRAQGRPPKDAKPIYVRSEEEAQLLLIQQRIASGKGCNIPSEKDTI